MIKKIYNKVKDEFAARGCYFLNKTETEKVRKTIIINGALNAKIVGQKPVTIAALAGVEVPKAQRCLSARLQALTFPRNLHMKSCRPFLRCTSQTTFRTRFSKAEQLIADGGYGHTSSIYLDVLTQQEKLNEFASRMKTCRILVNTPSSQGGIGDLYNFKLAPSLTLGCGSWGGNSVSEKRRRQASFEHQNSCREERKHALVQST